MSVANATGGFLQSPGERQRLSCAEIIQLDAPADVEWRDARVGDQIRGRYYTEQAEGEAIEFRVLTAPVVAGANSSEEFVRAKGQAADDIQFVHEHYQASRPSSQGNLPDGGEEAL